MFGRKKRKDYDGAAPSIRENYTYNLLYQKSEAKRS